MSKVACYPIGRDAAAPIVWDATTEGQPMEHLNALAVGTRLAEYEVKGRAGSGCAPQKGGVPPRGLVSD